MLDPSIPQEAAFQGGVFTRPQAYRMGHTRRQVRRWLEVRRWTVVAGSAIGRADLQVGPTQLGHASVLTWPGAVVSHECAGALHGFPITLGGIGTATVEPQRGLAARGLRAHRVPLSAKEIVWRAGLPLTDRHRTAVDLLATLGWDDCRDLLAWLVTRRILSLSQLDALSVRRAGRPGAQQLRRLATVARAGSLSAGEDLLHDVLRDMGLAGWRANAPIVVSGRVIAVADVLVDDCRLVLQVDGWRAHAGRESFQRDRSQQNALVGAGYTVLRFTWHDLTHRRGQVRDLVRAAVGRSRP